MTQKLNNKVRDKQNNISFALDFPSSNDFLFY